MLVTGYVFKVFVVFALSKTRSFQTLKPVTKRTCISGNVFERQTVGVERWGNQCERVGVRQKLIRNKFSLVMLT